MESSPWLLSLVLRETLLPFVYLNMFILQDQTLSLKVWTHYHYYYYYYYNSCLILELGDGISGIGVVESRTLFSHCYSKGLFIWNAIQGATLWSTSVSTPWVCQHICPLHPQMSGFVMLMGWNLPISRLPQWPTALQSGLVGSDLRTAVWVAVNCCMFCFGKKKKIPPKCLFFFLLLFNSKGKMIKSSF